MSSVIIGPRPMVPACISVLTFADVLQAGLEGKPTVFLFGDRDIASESFLVLSRQPLCAFCCLSTC
jgi:hypothetical protein